MIYKKGFFLLVVLSFMFMVNGCIYIPPNEHVGKPAPHSYKDSYYGDRYYHDYHRYY